MQDRYAGDIGDFGKLGLLRWIEGSGLTVGVNWYQHRARRPDGYYVEKHRELLASGGFRGMEGMGLKFCTTSQRYYFFIMRPEHAAGLRTCVRQMLQTPWREHFRWS